MLSLITTILTLIGAYVVIMVMIPLIGAIIVPIVLLVTLLALPLIVGFVAGRNWKKEKEEDKKK